VTKKKPRYESRVFDGRIIHSAEIGRIHKEVLDFERIEAISEPMQSIFPAGEVLDINRCPDRSVSAARIWPAARWRSIEQRALASLAKIRRLYRVAPVQGIPPLARFRKRHRYLSSCPRGIRIRVRSTLGETTSPRKPGALRLPPLLCSSLVRARGQRGEIGCVCYQ
jgi:hypothetical protein